MYSYEDRLRAVQVYIKLGKRVSLTIRQLCYPTENALKSRYSEYVQRLELPAGYARQPRYSLAHKDRTSNVGVSQELAPEAKQSAVIAWCMRPAKAQAVADDVGRVHDQGGL